MIDIHATASEAMNGPWIVSQSLAIVRWMPNPHIPSPKILSAPLRMDVNLCQLTQHMLRELARRHDGGPRGPRAPCEPNNIPRLLLAPFTLSAPIPVRVSDDVGKVSVVRAFGTPRSVD